MLKLQLSGPLSDRIIYKGDGKETTLFLGTLPQGAPGFVALWQAIYNWNLAQETAKPAPETERTDER